MMDFMDSYEDKRVNHGITNGVDLGKENSAPLDTERVKDHKHINKDKHREGSSRDKHAKDRDSNKKKHHKDKHRDKKHGEDKHKHRNKEMKNSDKKIKERAHDDGYFTHDTSACDLATTEAKMKQEAKFDEYDEDYSSKKRSHSDEDDDYMPERKKKAKASKRKIKEEDGWEDDFPTKKKVKKEKKSAEKPKKGKKDDDTKKKKVKEEPQDVWKWWEEQKRPDGVKWNTLEHKGPVFAPDYEPLPSNIKFFYDGHLMKLSPQAEEVAGFYARMLEHEYTTKDIFNANFFKDWRSVMTSQEKSKIVDLKKCNFSEMHKYFMQKSEERKNMSKEEKKALKEENLQIVAEYGFCIIDGHKQRIGNFKIEPPGLFRGRGEHPKQGRLKRRVNPEDVIINCGKSSKIPVPPNGHKWKEVRHDNSVTWLASWTENIANQTKYVMLNAASKLKGEKDWQKYETARKLHRCVDKIRENYRTDWKSKEMKVRQRAVALYFIDKLALRAGNEKEEGETADTVGCCSLRVEHISLDENKDGKQYVVTFDFLGKDSIRYYNEVPVEKRVFKNLQLFMENKQPGDDLFDRLTTAVLNKHLNELMEGLTAKVFRTYNASITLQEQLKLLTDPDTNVAEKILSYNRANRAVAILCNHQRTAPKTHAKTMENIKLKIDLKEEQVREAQKQFKAAKKGYNNSGSQRDKINLDKKKKAYERLKEQLAKLQVQATDKEENKEIALGTSKLNYLDPRITVAWCKKYDIPVEKVYNKTQREKFQWAIDMAGPEYIF